MKTDAKINLLSFMMTQDTSVILWTVLLFPSIPPLSFKKLLNANPGMIFIVLLCFLFYFSDTATIYFSNHSMLNSSTLGHLDFHSWATVLRAAIFLFLPDITELPHLWLLNTLADNHTHNHSPLFFLTRLTTRRVFLVNQELSFDRFGGFSFLFSSLCTVLFLMKQTTKEQTNMV